MSKPWIHAQSSARRYGGRPEDYLPIHNLMDSSKSAFADNRHRVLTHNAWFIGPDGLLEMIFGPSITNSDGKQIPTRSIGEQHILEDFAAIVPGGIIPTVQDYLENMTPQDWMQNVSGSYPSSAKEIVAQIRARRQARRKDNVD